MLRQQLGSVVGPHAGDAYLPDPRKLKEDNLVDAVGIFELNDDLFDRTGNGECEFKFNWKKEVYAIARDDTIMHIF